MRYGRQALSGAIDSEPAQRMLDGGVTDVAGPERLARRVRLEKLAPLRVSTVIACADAGSPVLVRLASAGSCAGLRADRAQAMRLMP